MELLHLGYGGALNISRAAGSIYDIKFEDCVRSRARMRKSLLRAAFSVCISAGDLILMLNLGIS